jgi:hypothetical protein
MGEDASSCASDATKFEVFLLVCLLLIFAFFASTMERLNLRRDARFEQSEFHTCFANTQEGGSTCPEKYGKS